MVEVKEEEKGDHRADGDRQSESSCATATATPTATNEVDQAIKQALRVSNTSFHGLMALPMSFFTPYSERETSRDTSKNGSGCDEEDFRLCSAPSSTAEVQSPNVCHAGGNAGSISEHIPDLELDSQGSVSKGRVRKRRDRPLSLTKSGVARKGRKTYTERDLQVLEEFYTRDPFACANADKRQTLCHMLDIDPYRVSVFGALLLQCHYTYATVWRGQITLFGWRILP
ncbi:hypothetical protein COOONC_13805 [Cooperia oncophora]